MTRRSGRLGPLAVVHPFPSLAQGTTVLVLALLAGAAPAQAISLGLGMLSLHFAIGAANDVVDAPSDARAKPGKPIPSGRISRRTAGAVAVAAAAVGLGLSAANGVPVLVVGVLVLGAGLAYDAALKPTVFAWLPYAVELPLVPAHAWLGATGTLPPAYAVIFPAAAALGLALNLANTLVDLEADRAVGARNLAVVLGRARAVVLLALAQLAVFAIAWTTLLAVGGPSAAALALLVAATVVAAVGVHLSRAADPQRRERGWQAQVVSAALLATGWLLGVVL